jgi:Tol biopolymer transport system component
MRGRVTLTLAACLCALAVLPGAARAAAPTIGLLTLSHNTTTSTILEALIDPQGKATRYHFEYGPGDCSANPCTQTPEVQIPAKATGKGDLTSGSQIVSNLEPGAGTLTPGQAVEGIGIAKETTIRSISGAELVLSKPATQSGTGVKLTAGGPQLVGAPLEGLTPGAVYHFRVVADNGETAESPDRTMRTYQPPQEFGPCPNDALRLQNPDAARIEHPSSDLPDCRAYEQATPVDKDGGDAAGTAPFLRASSTGGAVTFLSLSGTPGALGSQEFPLFLAQREGGNWVSRGLLPPASTGQKAAVLGWTPNFSDVYTKANQLGLDPLPTSFLGAAPGATPATIAPYLGGLEPHFAGASDDGSEVLFESRVAIPGVAGAIEGRSNVYLWDEQSEVVSLAGVLNDAHAPPAGAFAGPYDWLNGTTPSTLSEGGAARGYYTQDTNAISKDGKAIYFTAAGSGRLYERLNPAAPQSGVDGEGNCTESLKACTIDVSTSERTKPDPAGDRPAAFQAASTDGSKALFTSSEMLTDDANTGPEQEAAEIQTADLTAEDPQDTVATVLPVHAKGIATDGVYLYWADPQRGTIGRERLDGTGPVEESFIVPSTGVPQFVTVAGGYLYWSAIAAGELPEKCCEAPVHGEGEIGRAKLNGSEPAGEVDATFISQASAPQGLAVQGEFIYWANRNSIKLPNPAGLGPTIGHATLAGGSIDEKFIELEPGHHPVGLAADGSNLFWGTLSENSNTENFSVLERSSLAGTERVSRFIGGDNDGSLETEIRGLALDGSHVYWASAGKQRIGRADLALDESSLEESLLQTRGAPIGVALDGSRIYWSSNGESPPNPGDDLYESNSSRPAGHTLTDLAPDHTDTDGIDVKGVLAASADGSFVYFAANGVPDGVTNSPNPRGEVAEAGNCQGILSQSTSGSCNLYLAHDGGVGFIARLDSDGGSDSSDALNWMATPKGIFSDSKVQKTARISADGQTLLFRSQRQLTDYENHGNSQYYLYRAADDSIRCVSCNPTGAGTSSTDLGNMTTSTVIPTPPAGTLSHNLSADGSRVFFETDTALVAEDTNGQSGCPRTGSLLQQFHTCTDTYEWEAQGTGSCDAAHAVAQGGCLYLISTGRGDEPQMLADASADGNEVFFFSRSRLVGQDADDQMDIYSARVDGGLPAQNAPPSPPLCEGEACKGAPSVAPQSHSPGTANFAQPARSPQKPCKRGTVKRHGSCVKKHKHHKKRKNHRRGHRGVGKQQA